MTFILQHKHTRLKSSFFGPKFKGKSRWTFWIQQDFKESIVVLISVEEVEVEANKFYQKKYVSN